MKAKTTADRALVAGALSGDQLAGERLLRRSADTIWTACRLLTREEDDARQAFSDVATALQADDFHRLKPYDGRSPLDSFVALVTRDLLAQRLLQLLQADSGRGWRAFQHFFQADIHRLIFRRLPGDNYVETRRDAYQEICVSLLDNDCRRLKAHNTVGSFAGFILQTADRLLIDFIRSFSMRRRAPAAISRLPALEQEIFRLVHWQGADPEIRALTAALARRLKPQPTALEVSEGLERVQHSLPSGYGSAATKLVALTDAPELSEEGFTGGPSADSPEDVAIEREAESLLLTAAGALREVASTLPEAERLYLQIALGGAEPLPARELARLMQRPVEEVYKVKQQVLKHLKDALETNEAVKKWRVSV